MALNGNDVVVTDSDGSAHGYVFASDPQLGEAAMHTKTAPSVPLNIGSGTPATAGGQYDVRDAEGEKAITHLDWTLGAGQRSLDAEGASPYRFWDSSNMDVESAGKLQLLPGVDYTPKAAATGPCFSALGYLWMAQVGSGVNFSSDGTTWTAATWPANVPDSTVSSFCSDGTFIYASIPGGTYPGVYKGTMTGGACAFTKHCAEKVSHIAWAAGYLFGARSYLASTHDAKAAILDAANSYAFSTAACTPAVIASVTSVGLASAGNAVYWVVSQGSQSFVYKLAYDPDAKTMTTEQFMELPSGFIATCALGYLSSVYVGGYWESDYAGYGMGSLYVCADGYAAPLVNIGERPEHTPTPEIPANDNRIFALTSGAKDIYFSTNRAVYRWDIDQGGYSHCFDLTASGMGASPDVWLGSAYSWDGSDMTATAGHRYPSGWTDTDSGTCTWSTSGGVSTIAGGGTTTLSCSPTAGDALSNATGTTLAIRTGAAHAGTITVAIADGTRKGRVLIGRSAVTVPRYAPVWDRITVDSGYWRDGIGDDEDLWIDTSYESWAQSGASEWTDVSQPDGKSYNGVSSQTIPYSPGGVVRVTLKGGTFTASVDGDGDTEVLHYSVQTTAESAAVTLAVASGSSIDYVYLRTDGAYRGGSSGESLTYSGVAFKEGRVYAAYSVPSLSASRLITTSSVANPTVITTDAHHGFTNGQTVTISGHSGSTPSINGDHVVTSTGDHTFTIPVNVSVGGTGGYAYLKDNCKEGYATTGTALATTGSLTSSETNFHTGSMKKDFRFVDVSHEQLPGGSTISCTAWVDDTAHELSGSTRGNRTRFLLNQTGYSVKTRITLTPDTPGITSPVIKAVNVVWDFVRTKKHVYNLDCRAGAQNGRWREDPETAIGFLFTIADRRATFEDRFIGSYSGSIDDIKFQQAQFSTREGTSGVVQITVREET